MAAVALAALAATASGVAGAAAPDPTSQLVPATATPEQGGEVTWMVFVAMSSLDPKMNDAGGACCDGGQIYGVYDSLVRVDAIGEVTPRLAESVTPDTDFTTWTIALRPDVTFTDGTAFDADAVKVNMDRHKDPAIGSRCVLQAMQIDVVTVLDDTTLEVELVGPNSQFPILLQGCLGLIASPTALDEYGDQYGSSPETTVGAGPFIVESFTPNDSSTLVRNPDFWDAPRPYVDKIDIVSAAANPQTAVDAIQTGDAQLATFMGAPSQALRNIEDAGFEAIEVAFFGGQGWGFNTTRPPLDDARVRRALTIAIDPAALNEAAFAGMAPRDDTFFPESSPYFDPTLTYPGYDMEEAQRLIDEYTAETGGTVDVTMTANELMSPVGVFAKQQYDQIDGLNFEIEVVSSAAVGDAYFSGSFDLGGMLLAGTTGYPTLFDSLAPDAPANLTGFSTPEIDAARAQILAADDLETIAEAYQAIARVVLDELPYGILWPQVSKTYHRDELQGVEIFRSHNVDLTLLHLA